MHSIRHSRPRILFEVFCALAVSASCVGAWLQTGASALLAAAGAALLYGLLHLFDMAGHGPAVAEEPQRIGFDADQPVEPYVAKEPVQPAEQAALPTSAKAPRKTRAKRATRPKDAQVIALSVPEQVELEEPGYSDDMRHLPLAPLFEPVPVVRQQRTLFGRKAG